MRFSVDAHAIGQKLTGNETYVRNLLQSFAALDEDAEFYAYISRPTAADEIPAAVRTRLVSVNPYVRLGYDLPRRLKDDRPAVLHVQYTAPVTCAGVPLVVTVHDVSYLSHPQYFTGFRRRQLRLTVKATVRRAAKVLAVSEFSRKAILDAYGIDDSKVVVVPNGTSARFRPMAREAAAAAVRERFGISGPFVLTVGDLQPRKNHLGLIRAFESMMRSEPRLNHQLVFVGKDTWHSKEVHEAAARSPLAERIRFTGFVSDEDLVALYGACELFVFPSFYEGFGLPILEAMACGRAVACSNTSAIPEVADSAALLFDPESSREMVLAMKDLLVDAELRARMERLALARAAQFSWERAARQTLEVYYDVAGKKAAIPAEQAQVAGL
jgi:glycosyltransferase involved in cell wall biosynthesis